MGALAEDFPCPTPRVLEAQCDGRSAAVTTHISPRNCRELGEVQEARLDVHWTGFCGLLSQITLLRRMLMSEEKCLHVGGNFLCLVGL